MTTPENETSDLAARARSLLSTLPSDSGVRLGSEVTVPGEQEEIKAAANKKRSKAAKDGKVGRASRKKGDRLVVDHSDPPLKEHKARQAKAKASKTSKRRLVPTSGRRSGVHGGHGDQLDHTPQSGRAGCQNDTPLGENARQSASNATTAAEKVAEKAGVSGSET